MGISTQWKILLWFYGWIKGRFKLTKLPTYVPNVIETRLENSIEEEKLDSLETLFRFVQRESKESRSKQIAKKSIV